MLHSAGYCNYQLQESIVFMQVNVKLYSMLSFRYKKKKKFPGEMK